jgi:photosystem II stability/assembly factor-like uncharacterized protein
MRSRRAAVFLAASMFSIYACHLDNDEKTVFNVHGDESWTAFSRLCIVVHSDSGRVADTLFDGKLTNLDSLEALPAVASPVSKKHDLAYHITGFDEERIVLEQDRRFDGKGRFFVDTLLDVRVTPKSMFADTDSVKVQRGSEPLTVRVHMVPKYADPMVRWTLVGTEVASLDSAGPASIKVNPRRVGVGRLTARSMRDSSASISIIVTITPAPLPSKPIVSSPRTLTTDVQPVWKHLSGGANGCGIFRRRLDDSSFESGADTVKKAGDSLFLPPQPLEDGIHTLYVQEGNCLGDWSGTASFSLRVRGQSGFAVGDSGVLLRTIDAGKTWSRLETGTSYPIKSISFPDFETGYAAGGDTNTNTRNPQAFEAVLLKTVDGGKTWAEMPAGSFDCHEAIHFWNKNEGFSAGYRFGGKFMITADGGQTLPEFLLPYLFWPYALAFPSNQVGFVGGRDKRQAGTIIKTSDAGRTWDSLPLPYMPSIFALAFPSADTGFVGGADGYMFKTVDGGATWERMASGGNETIRAYFFTSTDTGYAVGTAGTLLKTVNSGQSWSKLPSGTTSNLYSVFFTDPQTGYAAGDKGVLLKTTDGGKAWKPLIGGKSYSLKSLFFP